MHEAVPYGHLIINGNPVTDTQLANLTGTITGQLSEYLGELETAGVYSKTATGVIYSRRMNRDEKRSIEGRKHIKKRWEQVSENKEEKPPPNSLPNSLPKDNLKGELLLRSQKLEARSQKKEKRFAFSGAIIKLTESDFQRWQKSYHSLDLSAELTVLDDYYREAGVRDWFNRCSRALLNAHNRNQHETSEQQKIMKDAIREAQA